MEISATEFQQKVGYYLNLIDQGENITIKKSKPVKKKYKIMPLKVSYKNEQSDDWIKNLKKKVRKYNLSTSLPKGIKNSIQYQRWVRS